MIFKLKFFLLTLILAVIAPGLSFCQYAALDAKAIYINGPESYDLVGVALSQKACDKLIAVMALKDAFEFEQALNSPNILRIKNHTPALVLAVDFFAGKAKVIIAEGLQKGYSGWVPIEWLKDNQSQPVFSKNYQFLPYDFSKDSPIIECPWAIKKDESRF